MAFKVFFPRFQKEPVTLPFARALKLALDKETISCMPIHYDYFPKHFGTWTKRYPNNHVLLDWYIYSLICRFCNPAKGMSVLEIGAGSGNLVSLISNYSKPETITIVDLPETLQLSLLYLGSIFTEKTFSLQPADPALEKGKADFNFLTPSQIDSIPSASIDLAINCHSFQEMNPETIERYFQLVRRVMRPGGIFIVINRVEKSPVPDESINSVNDVVVRLSTYPWESDAIDLYYQISHMHKLIQNDPVQIRVQKYA
jgi:SAM-dependent methyltransferase